MQDPGSVRVNQDHGSLASRVGSRVSVADPVPSLSYRFHSVSVNNIKKLTSLKLIVRTMR